MIWESGPWKQDLARRAKSLRGRKSQRRWPESSLAHVEQDLFVVAYSIRKLLDATKVSDEVEGTPISARTHKSKKRVIDRLNWHKIDELYDLSTSHPVRLTLREFCNQIIHSFVFVLAFDEADGLEGVFVASNRDRRERLFYLGIEEIAGALDRVAADDIVDLQMRRDPSTHEMKVIRRSSRLTR
jgi:hypothetical protein